MAANTLAEDDIIENMKKPSNDAFLDDQNKESMAPIHIRCQQRNGKKMITTIEGISPIYSHRVILKVMKRSFFCNGTMYTEKEFGDLIQLQGDQRQNVKDFLLSTELAKENQIKVHGF